MQAAAFLYTQENWTPQSGTDARWASRIVSFCAMEHKNAHRIRHSVGDCFVKQVSRRKNHVCIQQPKVLPIISCGSWGSFSDIPGILQRKTINNRFSPPALSFPWFSEQTFLSPRVTPRKQNGWEDGGVAVSNMCNKSDDPLYSPNQGGGCFLEAQSLVQVS